MGELQFSQRKRNITVSLCVIAAIIVIDQLIKYVVKTNFCLHESHEVTSWMYILFVENGGMAFGISILNTILQTVIRIGLVVLLVYYLHSVIVRRYPLGYIICVSLVLAGALGNIIDNAFYGLIYSESTDFHVAALMPFGEGDGRFMSGRVVDMFYFPIIQTTYPSWFPLKGGQPFVFFSPVFNFADASISCGAIAIILFYRKCLLSSSKSFDPTNASKRNENKSNK